MSFAYSLSTLFEWKWAFLAAIAAAILALMPQIHFWLIRGDNWQGSYAVFQGDEFLYSAYVNALIDGRPRRNDPYAGQDDTAQKPLPESLFSIQFVPAETLAWISRTVGISASSAFIVVAPVSAFLAVICICAVLSHLIDDKLLVAVGALSVLCFGTIVSGQGVVGLIFNPDVAFVGLTFLRRYEPGAPFFLFFLFCSLILRAFTSTSNRWAIFQAVLAGLVMTLLVFSYFYLWTAAFAWFVCILVFWHLTIRKRSGLVAIFAGLPTALAVAANLYLISRLTHFVDNPHALGFTHGPDLFQISEWIGFGGLVLLALAVRLRGLSVRETPIIVATSFCVLPFLVFNQQIISGRSIQPFHYQVFIVNYAVLIGWIIILKIWKPEIPRRSIILIALLSVIWGALEVNLPFNARYTSDVTNDEMVPVLIRLKDLSKTDGTWSGLRNTGEAGARVFSPKTEISKLLPTWSAQGSLLNLGSISFQLMPRSNRVDSLFTHLYFCGKDVNALRGLLGNDNSDPFLSYYVKSTVFGPERVLRFLSHDFQAIREDEIDDQLKAYQSFLDSFRPDAPESRRVSYAVVPASNNFDFSRIDRWYERVGPERVGLYDLYRLRMR